MTMHPGQMPLFGQSLDVISPLKRALADTLRNCRLSREQVVDEINRLLEGEGLVLRVTLNSLEKWCAPSASHLPPVWVLPFFCQVVGSLRPLEVLSLPLGAHLMGEREQHLMELGRVQLEAKKVARARRRALEALEDSDRVFGWEGMGR